MAIKNFYFSQIADLRIEGVGIHASYSVNLTVTDENTPGGKNVSVAATGKSNAAKAAGSGNLLFWCKVKNTVDSKLYVLERKKESIGRLAWMMFLLGLYLFLCLIQSTTAPPWR